MDVGGDLVIDVDGTDIILKDGGTKFGDLKILQILLLNQEMWRYNT